MKNIFFSVVTFFVSLSAAHAADNFKDFAGQKCKKSDTVTIVEIAKMGIPNGPMKGYVNVTVTVPSGETSTAPMPGELVKKIKVGDRACRSTFVDEE